jgi:hypothetical protein
MIGNFEGNWCCVIFLAFVGVQVPVLILLSSTWQFSFKIVVAERPMLLLLETSSNLGPGSISIY